MDKVLDRFGLRRQPEIPQVPYDVHKYYSLSEGNEVLAAHKTLTRKYPPAVPYWIRTERLEPGPSYRVEELGSLRIITGKIGDIPLSQLAVIFDTTSKSYLDQGALGEKGNKDKDRGKEISRFNSLVGKNLLVTSVSYNGAPVGGNILDIGESERKIGEILQSPQDGIRHLSTIAELIHAGFRLSKDHPLFNVPENVTAEGKRHYVIPFSQLQSLLGVNDEERTKGLRRDIKLALRVGGLHVAQRWTEETDLDIRYTLGESPNKTLIEVYEKETEEGKGIFIAKIPEKDLYPESHAIIPDRMHLITAQNFSVGARNTEEELAKAFPENTT